MNSTLNSQLKRLVAAQARLDGDIEELVMQVMLQAAQNAEDDLREIMREMQAQNAAKKALRDLIRRMNRDRVENELRQAYEDKLDFSKGMGSERAYHRVPLPVVDVDAPGGIRLAPGDLWQDKLTRVEQLAGIIGELKDKLDSLSELSEMTSLRLQMAVDRRSKFMETLSNIMKKSSETQASIIQNLK